MTTDQIVAHALDEGRPATARAAGSLTPRERQVVALVARGLTNREIATELVVSRRTVETHVQNSLRKLALTSRAEIAAWVNG
ncbi:response regulator transcription factor [Actinoplanes subtropicus]|uniref:response regulator transcription factor n=1 Tax=Actinoplanes subtropicus TaxID=543632 RepID=UPI0004C3A8B5|nr:LuxR C-terminal-related transcriptional regulator [Actinoplanes subtropicus]